MTGAEVLARNLRPASATGTGSTKAPSAQPAPLRLASANLGEAEARRESQGGEMRPRTGGLGDRLHIDVFRPSAAELVVEPQTPTSTIVPVSSRRLAALSSPRANAFTCFVDRTVDGIKSGRAGPLDELQRLLAGIKLQYDEVHLEAERREVELTNIRRDLRFADVQVEPLSSGFKSWSRSELLAKIDETSANIESALEVQKVYKHMRTRLGHELRIVRQKQKIMEEHLQRKTREARRKQELSRKLHQEKLQSMDMLEAMEQDVDAERHYTVAALEEFDAALQQKKDEVKHRADFERWRYQVALEAANEAFQATAGRHRKIYAIEKLTGSCLQKIIFEQAEQSQATEDGFQKIREVTGLTDVMDIVQKFLNRDVEHEQLRTSVREAEQRLNMLRETEGSKHTADNLLTTCPDEVTRDQPVSLAAEVAEQEHQLGRAQHELEEIRARLRRERLLLDSVVRWAQKVSRSLGDFEALGSIESHADLLPFFHSLEHTVDRFLNCATAEHPPVKLSKLTMQASTKENAEQQRLLGDQDFIRSNCRVAAGTEHWRDRHRHGAAGEDERHEMEVLGERERLKQEARSRCAQNSPIRSQDIREVRPRGGEGRESFSATGPRHSWVAVEGEAELTGSMANNLAAALRVTKEKLDSSAHSARAPTPVGAPEKPKPPPETRPTRRRPSTGDRCRPIHGSSTRPGTAGAAPRRPQSRCA